MEVLMRYQWSFCGVKAKGFYVNIEVERTVLHSPLNVLSILRSS